MTIQDTISPVRAVDLEVQLARLDAVVGDLAVSPADRDAVLWAAHELATSARMLVGARRPDAAADGDLGAAVDHARSAMACLTLARRQESVGAPPLVDSGALGLS